jgi:hypothetical protein
VNGRFAHSQEGDTAVRACALWLALACIPACASEPTVPSSPTDAHAIAASEVEHGHHDDDHDDDDDDAPAANQKPLTGDAARILVLQTKVLDRPAEVVGVVDAHEAMGHHDAALLTLRRRAAAIGADAVVGVEFHHGEGEGEPTHLSGLAVRFLSNVPFRSRP